MSINETTTVTTIKSEGHGFHWTTIRTGVFVGPNEAGEAIHETITDRYRTNSDGEGLWVNNNQILGTTQFTLANVSPATCRRRAFRAIRYP